MKFLGSCSQADWKLIVLIVQISNNDIPDEAIKTIFENINLGNKESRGVQAIKCVKREYLKERIYDQRWIYDCTVPLMIFWMTLGKRNGSRSYLCVAHITVWTSCVVVIYIIPQVLFGQWFLYLFSRRKASLVYNINSTSIERTSTVLVLLAGWFAAWLGVLLHVTLSFFHPRRYCLVISGERFVFSKDRSKIADRRKIRLFV